LLESAGAGEAKVLISAINSPEINAGLIETVRKHFPHLKVMMRVKDRFAAYELMDLGVENLYRESVDTSVRLGVDVLRHLGHRAYSATRAGQNFLKYDEDALRKLATSRHDLKQYIFSVRQQIELQEQLLAEDRQNRLSTNDLAWDSEHMRDNISKQSPAQDGG
jgi:CPA2 family monovalent cation:H+ antiporter-2